MAGTSPQETARLIPSLFVQAYKTIRHPTDAAALEIDPGRRKPPITIAAVGQNGALPQCGPSCLQDPHAPGGWRPSTETELKSTLAPAKPHASIGCFGQFQNPSKTRNMLCWHCGATRPRAP